jgi:hypothetical protein
MSSQFEFDHSMRSCCPTLSGAGILLCILCAQSLAGCDSGSKAVSVPTPSSAPEPPPSPPTIAAHGHFLGTATFGGVDHFLEAIVTVDGAVRLYIGGQWDEAFSGTGPTPDLFAAESLQFVGSIDMNAGRGAGSGALIGQICTAPEPGRFCDEPASAQIRLTATSGGRLEGEVQVLSTARDEVWRLEMDQWSAFYALEANPAHLAGAYKEEAAPFAQGADVILTIDVAGRVFFQSADSGCTGNGSFVPHGGGEFSVYEVALTIESCDARYASLNSEFGGLAIQTQQGYWDYDPDWLVIFLSTARGAAALSLRGSPL